MVRFGPPLAALRGVAANGSLRRVEFAFLLFNAAEAAAWVAILVYAFDRGGAEATGLVGVLLLVPAGVAALFTGALGDRFRRERVLAIGYLVQMLAVASTGVAILTGRAAGVVYGFAIASAASMTTSRPAHHSILPNLARSPDELTAANSVSSLAEGLGGTFGALAAAGLLVTGTPGTVYTVMAACLGVAALTLVGLHAEHPWYPEHPFRVWTLAADAAHGIASIARSRDPRLVVALAGLMTVAYGAFDVLLVSVAIETLDLGEAGVGLLHTAIGVGALVGAAGSVALVGRRALGPALLLATMLMAAGIAGSALASTLAVVSISVVVAGAALTLMDVAGRTLLQRVADDDLLTRVFGMVEALWMAGVGVGSAIAAIAVRSLGLRTALLSVAGAIVVLTLPAIGGLRRLDRDSIRAGTPARAARRSVHVRSAAVAGAGAGRSADGPAAGDRWRRGGSPRRSGRPLLRHRSRRVPGEHRRAAGPRAAYGRSLRRDRPVARRAQDRHRHGRGRRGTLDAGPGRVPGHGHRHAAGLDRRARDLGRAAPRS